jgi:DNA mismatch endonuclease (patch repair protein)
MLGRVAISAVMQDHLSPEARSAHMRRIRKVNTGPEMRVRRVAHALGYRFRLHRSELPGTPDLVFPRLRKAVFVNGCFWHQHPGCKLARLPKSRPDYWLPKLRRNQERDLERLETLDARGWKVLVIWECETNDLKATTVALRQFLARTVEAPQEA